MASPLRSNPRVVWLFQTICLHLIVDKFEATQVWPIDVNISSSPFRFFVYSTVYVAYLLLPGVTPHSIRYYPYQGQGPRRMRSFAVAGPVIWNSLPAALRTATLSPLTLVRQSTSQGSPVWLIDGASEDYLWCAIQIHSSSSSSSSSHYFCKFRVLLVGL